MVRLFRSALALGLVAGLASPARAGCCDDFWSCAGAVATAGLTCAAQAALDALQALLLRATSTRDDLSARYEAQLQAELDLLRKQIAAVDTEIKDLVRQIDAAQSEGDKILHEDQDGIRVSLAGERASLAGSPRESPKGSLPASGAKTRVSGKAGPATLVASASEALAGLEALQADPSLQQLRQRLDELKKEKEAIVAQILKKEAQAGGLQMSAANAAAAAGRVAFVDQVLAPFDRLIGSLEAALANPLAAGMVVDAAIALLGDLARGAGVLLVRFVGDIDEAGNQSLAVVRPEVDALRKVAAEAQSVLAAMRKMTALRTAAARQALARAPLTALSVSPPASRKFGSAVPVADRAKTLSANLAALELQFQRFGRTPGSVNAAAFRPRLTNDFDAFFRGKSPADAKKKRAELLAEARRRFAADPKTLQAVEKLIADEARARGVPL